MENNGSHNSDMQSVYGAVYQQVTYLQRPEKLTGFGNFLKGQVFFQLNIF